MQYFYLYYATLTINELYLIVTGSCNIPSDDRSRSRIKDDSTGLENTLVDKGDERIVPSCGVRTKISLIILLFR